ncbi:MAG: S8 family peptidase [Chloroflexota bacterium]
MKTRRFPNLFGIVVVIAIIGVLISPAGRTSAKASQEESYIVQATTTSIAAQLVEKHGGTVTSNLDIVHAVGALLSAQMVEDLKLEEGIVAITPNGSIESSDKNTPSEKDKSKDDNKGVPSTDFPNVVGADLVWQKGVIGSNVTVAVLDTGIADIQQLAKAVDNKHDRIVAWKDFIEKSKKPIDPNGHGSHVAGIIANSQKGADGEWNGMAPDVKLAGVRVLDASGVGTYETVILGLQWVLENQTRYNIRIVNLSLVAPVQSPYWADPLDQAVTQVWAKGITVIVAAGNSGPEAMSITVPGNNPYVVTVGAFTDNFTPNDWNDDYITPFSSAGPTLDGFVKPDLVAPGGHIVSIVPSDSYLAKQYPNNLISKNYFKLAGTSQATAVVSGIAALVISKNPSITPNEVKMRLMSTALPWVDATTTNAGYSMWQQGAGIVNAPDAVFGAISGAANSGMDIQADLAGTTHYEGYSYYDEATSTYRLYDPFADWAGGYGTWDGSRGSWSGSRGSWSGDYGAWVGSRGSWSGSRGSWSGGYDTWSGSRGSWSGSRGSWSGGYSTWAGSRGSWSGNEPWAGSIFADPAFVSSFMAGESPNAAISNATTSYFLEDQ